MPNRPNIAGLQVLGELRFDGYEEKLKQLQERIDLDDGARQEWLDKRRDIEEHLRGEKKRKNPPWKGASELSPPLTKKLIRRWIPVVYNLTALAEPLSHFKSGTAQAAQQAPAAEQFFGWLIREYMDDVQGEIALLANGVASYGQDYLAVDWDYRTENEVRVAIAQDLFPRGVPDDQAAVVSRLLAEYDIQSPDPQLQASLLEAAVGLQNGAPAVRVEYRRVVADKPRIQHFDSGDVIVPTNSAQSYDAEYVALRKSFTKAQLLALARDGVLNAEAVGALLSRLKENDNAGTGEVGRSTRRTDFSNYDSIKREQLHEAGVQTISEHDPITVYHVYCWMDKNGDGLDERVILWYSPHAPDITLAVHDFPFSFKMWPVVRFDFEKIDRRPHRAHGMGTMLLPIQEQLTKQFRAKSDAIDIQLLPVFQAKVVGEFKARNIKWAPGKVIPVMNVGDIGPIEKNPFNLDKYIQNDAELMSFGEQMVGSIDAALQATGRNLERRSATEVQAIAGQIGAIQSMDAALWQISMGKVFQIVWEMWLDLGPAEIYFQVTGRKQPEPFTKSQYNYHYQLVPAGTPGNTNRRGELARLIEFVQSVAPWGLDLVNRPFLITAMANMIDPRFAQGLVLPEVQAMAQRTIQQAAAALSQGEIPDVLQALAGTPDTGAAPA
jgi:hypothetical protein